MTMNSEDKPTPPAPKITPSAAAPAKTFTAAPTPAAPATVLSAPAPAAPKAPAVQVAPIAYKAPSPSVAAFTPAKAPKMVKPRVEALKTAAAPKVETARPVKAAPAGSVKKAKVKRVAPVAARAKSAAPKPILAKAVKISPREAKGPIPVEKAVKPALEAASEGILEIPRLMEAQMKKIQQRLSIKAFDLGDLHIANAELHELVENQRDAAIETIRNMTHEMEKFFESSVQESLKAGNQLMRAKSLPELIEMQSRLTRDGFEACLEHGRQLSAIANTAALNAFRPLALSWGEKINGSKRRAS